MQKHMEPILVIMFKVIKKVWVWSIIEEKCYPVMDQLSNKEEISLIVQLLIDPVKLLIHHIKSEFKILEKLELIHTMVEQEEVMHQLHKQLQDNNDMEEEKEVHMLEEQDKLVLMEVEQL